MVSGSVVQRKKIVTRCSELSLDDVQFMLLAAICVLVSSHGTATQGHVGDIAGVTLVEKIVDPRQVGLSMAG